MFAYCRNNPVMRDDPTGEVDWDSLFEGVGLLTIGITACAIAAAAVSATACLPLLIAAGVTFAAGGMTVANGAAEVVESATGYNYMSDTVYGGDRQYYEGQKQFFSILAESGTAALSMASQSMALCFVSGTVIITEEGQKVIESIELGDYVWAWDEETGDVALKEVVETYVNETEELVHVFVDDEEIITTPSHPFYSPVKGWTDAVKLRAGDILVLVNGEYVVVEKVQHEILEAPVTVYNFQVEDYHTYYVANGVLVHNSCGWKSIKESSKAWNTIKGFNATQMEIYENVITKLASGDTSGLNIHRLSNGYMAADLPGFGKGRGQGRIIYQIIDGVIEIIEITTKHYK